MSEMELVEYEEEGDYEFDFDEPVEGICFHVTTEFNLNHTQVKRRFRNKATNQLQFEPRATHPEAMHVADIFAVEIQKKFRGSAIKRIAPDLRSDEFHLYIVDHNHIPIAKIGVVGEDYRDRTIH